MNAVMGIDTTLPKKWWIPIMDKAARLLIEADRNYPRLPTAILYKLSYLTAVTFDQLWEISIRRADSVGSDLSDAVRE